MTQIDALIERWRQGDERAAELLYDAHQGRAYRLAYGLLGHAADAEEAAQDALTYALVNIHRFDSQRASFSTWLHTITVSRCRDKRRRKLLPRLSLTAWLQKGLDVADPNLDPEGETAVSEIRSQVWNAVQKLPPPYREAIVLRYWAGHTYREMADILKCPVPTAQSRVRLAFKQLRATLEPADLAVLEQHL